MQSLNCDEIANLLSDWFELIESTFSKFNCFKFEINGDTFTLMSGMGEQHATDHVAEMAFGILELLHETNEQNESLPENLQLKIRAGVHVGACHSRVVYMQMPRMMICSTLVQVAAAAHAQCLRKFQYSDLVPL